LTDPSPSVSVVIVAWNSSRELAGTIPALLAELSDGDEVVVVDNDSTDGSAAAARELAPAAVVVETGANLGFAAGANRGAEAASGDLVVFLNPDAVPQPGFGEAIRRPMAERRGWAGWMGLVTAEQGRVINSDRGVLHFTGIAWAGDAGAPVERARPAGPVEVPFLSGACMAVPRELWLAIGGFSEGYFLYHEDVDVSLRLRLEGGTIGIEPAAVVDHDYEFSRSPEKYRYLERNRWSTVLRTYPAPLLGLLAPGLLATELALYAVAVANGWGRLKLAADVESIRSLGETLDRRRAIQARRRVSAAAFASHLTADLDSAFLGPLAANGALRWALRAYWAAVRALLR
jgi:GT2 family glycosyltransferase